MSMVLFSFQGPSPSANSQFECGMLTNPVCFDFRYPLATLGSGPTSQLPVFPAMT